MLLTLAAIHIKMFVIMLQEDHPMKTVIATASAPAAIGPYSQGIKAGNLIITSGQLPIDPATGAFPEGIEEQTRQSLKNVMAILAEAGAGADNIIKTTKGISIHNNSTKYHFNWEWQFPIGKHHIIDNSKFSDKDWRELF